MDNIRDLFFAMDHPHGTPPKLEIKMDANKMVYLKHVVMKARDARVYGYIYYTVYVHVSTVPINRAAEQRADDMRPGFLASINCVCATAKLCQKLSTEFLSSCCGVCR